MFVSAATPIAKSKTAALARILDSLAKGYTRYTCGQVKVSKAVALANKFHRLYGVGCTPAQRVTRKKHGFANALLVMFWPEDAENVEWLMLFTAGSGAESEHLRNITDKPRLNWLGYELVRHAACGKTVWTWKRPKAEMGEHLAFLKDTLAKHHYGAVADALTRIANQPGFHGVREQSWSLCQFARRNGYPGELPFLFYLQKVSHGDKLLLTDAD
ncbi:hypothetical protein [Chitinibacter tainanensis]|uniref:hypothetical protein n=1 Tax=Chitinibacter tainanensis TaxID=230667 RepID=UPI00041D3EF3